MLVLFSPFFAGFAIAQALRARRQGGAVFEQKTYAGKNAKPVSLSLFALSDADDVLDRILAVSGMRYYPALAAVFLGRFSFIGPKPFTLPDSAATGEDAFVRFSVRPGLFSSLERFGGKSLTYPDLFEEDAEYAAHFTLFGDCSHGNRPSFIGAARPEHAEPLYAYAAQCLRAHGVPVRTGVFGADMKIEQCNDGPVTILYEC